MPYDAGLAARIRGCLEAVASREVAMYGGRSFMVDDHLALSAASDGMLLVRCAPDRVDQPLQRAGVRPAEMRGRAMSCGWHRIDLDAVVDDTVLQEWIDDAGARAQHRTP